MIIDVTGIQLVPGNCGRDCPGNGESPNIECCCDECDYLLCCMETHTSDECAHCHDGYCPNAAKCDPKIS